MTASSFLTSLLESEYMVEPSKLEFYKSHDKLNASETNENNDNESDIAPSDSASPLCDGVSDLSRASNRSTTQQIEINKRRADLKITHELQKS